METCERCHLGAAELELQHFLVGGLEEDGREEHGVWFHLRTRFKLRC